MDVNVDGDDVFWRSMSRASKSSVTTWRNLRRFGAARVTPGRSIAFHVGRTLATFDAYFKVLRQSGGG